MKKIEEYVRTIPDFPEKGIMFRDITSVLADADGLKLAIDEIQKKCGDPDTFDVVVGAESRGFIFGAPVAYNLHKPFVLVRKKGKLPCETIEQSYDLVFFWAPKSLQMVIAAMKLKDAYSLEGSYDQPR